MDSGVHGLEFCTGHALLGTVGGSKIALRNKEFLIPFWPSPYARACSQWAGRDFLFPGLRKVEIQNGTVSDPALVGLGQF